MWYNKRGKLVLLEAAVRQVIADNEAVFPTLSPAKVTAPVWKPKLQQEKIPNIHLIQPLPPFLPVGHGTAEQRFRLKEIDGRYHVEAKKVNIGDEMCVLSLLQRYG